MTAYCYEKYAPIIEQIFIKLMLEGDMNWQTAPTLKIIGRDMGKFTEQDREDSIRRVADDMVRNRKLQKRRNRYAMYKYIYEV